MDCKYTTIKTCELNGSTFRSHLLNFGDFDISEYTFSAGFSNSLGQKLNDVDLVKVGNSVILPLTSIENRSGRFRSDVWMETEGNKDLAVRFDISISDTDCGCTDDTTHDITITFQELVIPVTVTQAVVNINLDFESLTPEQKADLRFDWEDFTPENIAELQQPAIEAAGNANEAAVLANQAAGSAETAANEATQAASGATNAINGANTAAANANQAAGFATSATQEAATATGQATAAASSANSAATAANAGSANAEAKAILADTAASNAQAKATLADSAAANANDKAGIAQTAATNADQKAAAAQTATNNANTATTNANTATSAANAAAATANAARGWQPLLVADTTTIPGKTLLKLSDWIGGTGTKPNNYVGQWQKADGTYTAVASEAMTLFSNVSEDFLWANKNLNDFSLSGYYNSAGVLTANTGYVSTTRMRAKAGMKFKNPFLGTSTFRQVAYFGVGGNIIATASNENESIAPANTYYVAFTRTSGSSVPVQVQSDFWALQQSDFISEYTTAENKEIIITSIDYATSTFYAPNHGLTSSTLDYWSELRPFLREGFTVSDLTGRLPFNMNTSVRGGFNVINVTQDTFQISSNKTTPITLTDRGGHFDKWKFEQAVNIVLSFNELNHSQIRVEITGGHGPLLYLRKTDNNSNNKIIVSGTNAYTGTEINTGLHSFHSHITINIRLWKGRLYCEYKIKGVTQDSATALKAVNFEYHTITQDITTDSDIKSIRLNHFHLQNGSIIKIFKV